LKIYTGKGDDGTTGLFYGGRVAKDDHGPEAYGTVDEAVSAMGVARAAALAGGDEATAGRILELQRELFALAAELATSPENRSKLEPGVSRVTGDMVTALETAIDHVVDTAGAPTSFVVPGGHPVAAALDVARTVVRRAERRAVTHLTAVGAGDSVAVPYLNRLADYLYMLARAVEGEWVPSRPKEVP
jgi:cob(I)alamin adenosyltransferase